MTTLQRAPAHDPPLTVIVAFLVLDGHHRGRRLCGAVIGWVSQPGACPGLAADPAGRGGAARAGRASQPAHHRLAEQARGHGRLVRGHRRGLRGRPAHRGRAGRDHARASPAGPAWSHCASRSPWAPASHGCSRPAGRISSAFVAILRPLADHGTGRMLVEDPSIAEYYLASGSQWQRWSSTRNIVLRPGPPPAARAPKPGSSGQATRARSPCTSPGLLLSRRAELRRHDRSDQSIAADMRRNRHYHAIQVVPYGTGPAAPGKYVIWRYEPQVMIDQPTVSTGTMARPTAAGRPAAWPGASRILRTTTRSTCISSGTCST